MNNFQSLKLNKEFKTLYYHGKWKAHPLVVTYARKNRTGQTRIGITTGKKIGNAVKRNRSKRIIRHAFYNINKKQTLAGWDFVFVCRDATPGAKSWQVERVMKKHIELLTSPEAKKV